MFSKKDDKNLRISQIHHKRKEDLNRQEKKIFGSVLNIILAILIIGPSTITIGNGMYENVINDTEGGPQEDGIKYVGNKSFVEDNGYQLVWNDEFSSTALNNNFWSPRYGRHTPTNVKVDNGNLILTVKKNESGKVKGGGVITLQKYNFKYGYIEIRAKVAKGKGLTTGFWLTGQYHYPPEIDIMEYIGKDINAIYLSRHCRTDYDSTCNGWNQFPSRPWWLFWTKRYVENDWSLDYHTYGTEWTPNYIRWIVDGVERYRVSTGVSQEPMWITMSACGDKCLGTFDGPIDSTTPFPANTYIDYIRVYQKGQSSAGVTIVSPNGGEILEIGTTKKINWISSGSIGSSVKVELLKNGALNSVISSNTANDGSYDWAIPPSQVPGTDYKVKITSTSNSVHADTSNSNFVISPIMIVSPNGGDNLVRGTAKTIKWSYTGNPGSYVKIELLKGGVLNKVISSNTPIGSSGSGSYNWNIPTIQVLGSDYKIRVTSTGNSAYTDTSNNNFKISTQSVIITSPNGGESWTRGSIKTIKWSFADTGKYVKIELYKGGILNKVISPSTSNDGSYSWAIPLTQTIGSNYKIKITSTNNSAYTDKSNSNFKIN